MRMTGVSQIVMKFGFLANIVPLILNVYLPKAKRTEDYIHKNITTCHLIKFYDFFSTRLVTLNGEVG